MELQSNQLLSIVLLSFNSKGFLEQFLPMLIKFTPVKYEIIIVNNGSTDDTEVFLNEEYPTLRVIKIEKNKGFTNGYVESLKQINSKYYCLLSSDIEVTENWTEPIIDLMEKDESVAACQPKMKSWHKRNEFEYAGACGGYLDKYGYLFCRGRIFYSIEEDNGQYDETTEVFWASGGCFFVKSDLYHKFGGLDDDFFAHMEEVDLCWRLKNGGYKIMCVPDSEVYHVGGSIISYGSAPKTYRNYRNSLILLIKNLPLNQLLWKFPYRLALDGIAFFHLLFRGDVLLAFTIVKSHWHFHIKSLYWLKKRKAVRKLAVDDAKAKYFPQSIVWKYFIGGFRKFSELNWKY